MDFLLKYKLIFCFGIILSLWITLATCTKVDRVNPWDDKATMSPDEWAPKNLTIEDVSITEKKLTWTYEDKNIEGFKIERRINSGMWDSPFPILNKEIRSFADTTVIPDSSFTYEYRLFTFAGANQSAQLDIKSKAVFPAPTEVKTVKLSDVSYEISWKDNSEGEEGYRIDKRVGSDAWQIGFKNVTANQISLVDSNIFKSMALEYRVYAYFKTFESDKIAVNTVCDLPAPTNLQIVADGPTTAILTWQDNSNGEEGFRIGRQANNNYFEIIAIVPGNTVSYLDTSFSLNTTMHYWIWALAGQYASSELESFISPPTINTYDAFTITTASAQCGGIITGTNIPVITDKGICYGMSQNPTIDGNHTSVGAGAVSFNSDLNGLEENTVYFYSAYATTNAGTFYGDEKSFITLQITMPLVATSPVTNITQTSAISGGNVTYDGGSPVSERGVCWSTSQNPTITNSHTTNGTGTGLFTSSLTGLSANTLYYVRAYATNSAGISYGSQVSFTTQSAEGTVADFDGNVYSTVVIGTQTWLGENLKVTHYRNGVQIPNVTDGKQWSNLSSGAYCWYNNDEATYKDVYGALYNWYTIDDSRNLCPTGWHIPSETEWTILTTYLGGESVAGIKMKSSSGWYANGNGTNESGFTGLPGGFRYGYDSGAFVYISTDGHWWSSTEYEAGYAWYHYLSYNYGGLGITFRIENDGNSVRCLRD